MSKLAKILATGVLMATMAATLGSAPAFADNWHGGRGYHGDNGWHGHHRDYDDDDRGWRGSRVVYLPPPPPRVVYRTYPVYYEPYYAPPPPVVYRSSGFGFWFN